MNRRCSHPDCTVWLSHGNKTGLCAEHYRSSRAPTRRHCTVCGDPVSRYNTSLICLRHKSPVRKPGCSVCGAVIAKTSATGLCINHVSPRRQVPEGRIADFDYLCNTMKAADALAHILAGKPVHRIINHVVVPTMQTNRVIDAVGYALGIMPEIIIGPNRARRFVRARACVAVVLRHKGMSYPLIGKRLGRDHSSVVNLCGKFDGYAAKYPRLRAVADRLCA